MRRGFEQNLQQYNELVKDESREDLSYEEYLDMQGALNWHIRKASDRLMTSEEAQNKVYEIQRAKQQIMEKLQEDIADLEDVNNIPERIEGDKRIVYEGGKFFWRGAKEGKPNLEVSLGEIMTDGEWGLKYYLDPASVPRNIRKRYLIELAKQEIQGLLDDQIVVNESTSSHVDSWKKGAYERWHAERGSSRGGVIAERIVKNFLSKLVYDYHASFGILPADIFMDIEKKIDFIIQRKMQFRGVKVEEEVGAHEVGVQFTLQQDQSVLDHKKAQLNTSRQYLRKEDRVSDIMLVNVPTDLNFSKLYEEWKKAPMMGGPEKLLPKEIKQTFIKRILTGFVPENEIQRLAEVIH